MKNPPKVSDKDSLESEIHSFMESYLSLGSHKEFFSWLLNCKLTKYSVSGSLYRTYTTACDMGCHALKQALLCSTSELFGTFNPTNARLLNSDRKEREVFQIAKREFFQCIGFSEEVCALLLQFSYSLVAL